MLKKLFYDEEGQGMVEYGLIIGLVAVIVIAVFIVVGPKIKDMFSSTVDSTALDSAKQQIGAATSGQ